MILILTTKEKGDVVEIACILELKKLGITVSIPFGESAPYDIVADINGRLYKIQCKSSTFEDGCISFSCKTVHYNTKFRKTESYIGKIDFFMTYYGQKCYLVPIERCLNLSSKRLRVSKAKNNQTKNISLAEDYELQKIIYEMLV